MKNQADNIKSYILENVSKSPSDIVKKTAEHFKTSRTTVVRHINRLVDEGAIIKTGIKKQTHYALQDSLKQKFKVPLNESFHEFDIFTDLLEPNLKKQLNHNAFEICEYGVTEMLNNCKDHSKGTVASIAYEIENEKITIHIEDNGIGVFKNIQSHLKADDLREIALELNKGKLTTDKQNHTGEGIFFSSRMFDFFQIAANNVCYLSDVIEQDWSVHSCDFPKGTRFTLVINRNTDRNIVSVFQRYQDPETLAFTKTDITIKLADLSGTRLISRSQAKRVAHNLDKFTHVTLDFTDVQAVGQGFVDQIFRVTREQLGVDFDYTNANSDVEFMIKRGLATNS